MNDFRYKGELIKRYFLDYHAVGSELVGFANNATFENTFCVGSWDVIHCVVDRTTGYFWEYSSTDAARCTVSVDTGAVKFYLKSSVIKQLGLHPVGEIKSRTMSNRSESRTVFSPVCSCRHACG